MKIYNIYSAEFTDHMIKTLTSEPVKLMIWGFKQQYDKNPKVRSTYKRKINELFELVKAMDNVKKARIQ